MIDLLFPLCRVSCSRFVDQYGPVPAWPVSFFIHLFTAVRCRAVQCAAMERLSRRGRALRPLAEYGSRPSSYAASRVVRVELQNNAQASRRDFLRGIRRVNILGGMAMLACWEMQTGQGLLGLAVVPGRGPKVKLQACSTLRTVAWRAVWAGKELWSRGGVGVPVWVPGLGIMRG